MKRRAISRVTVIAVAAIIVVLLGTAFELATTYGGKAKPSFDAKPLLNTSYFGYRLDHPLLATPVGIASYGLTNDSGTISPYVVSTSEVVGKANISALASTTEWNYSVFPQYISPYCDQCAFLQMNVWVNVATAKGNQTYWVQNFVSFLSTTRHWIGNSPGVIYNETLPNANITKALGNGAFESFLNQTIYTFGISNDYAGTYVLPFDVTLKISVSVDSSGNGIDINMSREGAQLANSPVRFNSTVFFPIKEVTSASILVSPYTTISYGLSLPFAGNYDAELVWTGPCCGQSAMFNEMNSSLSLSYLNSAGKAVPFPTFYSFGGTGETATNLIVSPSNDAWIVTTGENDNRYLGG